MVLSFVMFPKPFTYKCVCCALSQYRPSAATNSLRRLWQCNSKRRFSSSRYLLGGLFVAAGIALQVYLKQRSGRCQPRKNAARASPRLARPPPPHCSFSTRSKKKEAKLKLPIHSDAAIASVGLQQNPNGVHRL